MKIKRMKMSELQPADYNPRRTLKSGDPEYERIKASINSFGMVEPIIWNKRTGNIVGGHQRYYVLLDLGAEETDVSVVDLDEMQEKALNIALNKITGDWDDEKLSVLLLDLQTAGIDLDTLGFSGDEIEALSDSDVDIDSFFAPATETEDRRKEITCPKCGERFEP